MSLIPKAPGLAADPLAIKQLDWDAVPSVVETSIPLPANHKSAMHWDNRHLLDEPDLSNAPFVPQSELTPQQEMILAQFPETLHSRVHAILTSPVPVISTGDGSIIRTVQAAVFQVKREELALVEEVKIEEPVVSSKRSPGRPRRDGLPAGSKGVNERAAMHNQYIIACQERKARIAALQLEIRHVHSNGPISAESKEYAGWLGRLQVSFDNHCAAIRKRAEETIATDRVQFNAYVAANRPPNIESGAELRAELNSLLANPIPRPILPK